MSGQGGVGPGAGWRRVVVALGALAILGGCSGTPAVPGGHDAGGVTGTDAGMHDGGMTDGGATDGGLTDGGVGDGGTTDAGTPMPAHAWIQVTGGGGSASNAGYHLRLNLGAPQPLGHASGAGHQVGAGPNAGP